MYLDLETVKIRRSFALNFLKQMELDDGEGEWSARIRLILLLVLECSKCHEWCKLEQSRSIAPFHPISKNSWRWWWEEVAARRTSKIEQELRKFQEIEVLCVLERMWWILRVLIWFWEWWILLELVVIKNIYASLIHTLITLINQMESD